MPRAMSEAAGRLRQSRSAIARRPGRGPIQHAPGCGLSSLSAGDSAPAGCDLFHKPINNYLRLLGSTQAKVRSNRGNILTNTCSQIEMSPHRLRPVAGVGAGKRGGARKGAYDASRGRHGASAEPMKQNHNELNALTPTVPELAEANSKVETLGAVGSDMVPRAQEAGGAASGRTGRRRIRDLRRRSLGLIECRCSHMKRIRWPPFCSIDLSRARSSRPLNKCECPPCRRVTPGKRSGPFQQPARAGP